MQTQLKNNITWNKWIAFTDKHAKQRTQWFLVLFVFQAVFCLPLPAALIYYYNAPVLCLGITVILFFINLALGMCGSGFRTIITFSMISLITNFIMLVYFTLR